MNRIVTYFKNLTERDVAKFLVIFYIVGITGFLVPQTRLLFERMIPLSLGINIFLMMLFHRPYNLKHFYYFVAIIAFTIGIEAIGVNTGILFGSYAYGPSLGLKVFATPVLIGFNWLMLTYGAVSIVRSVPALRKALPVLVGVLMVAFDFVMEPVAMKTAMWDWAFHHVPLQNYVMWFVISVVVASGYELFQIETKNKVAQYIFAAQLVFFIALNLFLK